MGGSATLSLLLHQIRSLWNEQKEENENRWSELPLELLELISDQLLLLDFLTFRNVCKSWLLASSRRSNIIHFSKRSQWLMFYGVDDDGRDMGYLYSDSHPEGCTAWLPHLRGATCLYSKLGWLLARRNGHLFFYNPFAQEKIDVINYPHVESDDQLYIFTSLPTSAGCTVYNIRRINAKTVEIYSCSVGDGKWHMQRLSIIDEVELGTLRFAKYFSIKNKNTIVINDSKTHLIYDCANRTFRLDEGGMRSIRSPFLEDLSFLHRSDWLKKFGREGIYISTCALSMKFARGAIIIDVDGRADTDVKAAWIEPPSKSRLPCQSWFTWS